MAMSRPHKRARDFFSASSYFKHLAVADRWPYLVNEINDLTGLCFPEILSRGGQSYIQYDWGICVVPRGEDRLAILSKAICDRQVLSLPRVLPAVHTLDLFISDGRASDWIVEVMTADMARYTMPARPALDFIERGDDKHLNQLVSVFGAAFEDEILRPLREMSDE